MLLIADWLSCLDYGSPPPASTCPAQEVPILRRRLLSLQLKLLKRLLGEYVRARVHAWSCDCWKCVLVELERRK